MILDETEPHTWPASSFAPQRLIEARLDLRSTINIAEQIADEAEARVAKLWHDRIVTRLAAELDRELRDGLPMRDATDLAVARRMIKELSVELKVAATKCNVAAAWLREKGEAKKASEMHQAAGRAFSVYEAVAGGGNDV